MIEIKGLSLNIDEQLLLSDLSITIEQGEFWAIIGKNGAGKTTLLHTLAGLQNYSEGSIKIDGLELNSLNFLTRAQQISLLPQIQESSLDCSVQQAVSYGRYAWHKNNTPNLEIITQALHDMEITSLAQKSIQALSGGELRKVEIATILAQDSAVMLLDEPLNHLDLAFRYKLMQKLKGLSQNKAIIMVTHDIQYVQQYCSHIIMFCGKSRVLKGKINDVLTEKNLTKMLGIELPESLLKNI
jgi:iron complex transport system ATP-binding protein